MSTARWLTTLDTPLRPKILGLFGALSLLMAADAISINPWIADVDDSLDLVVPILLVPDIIRAWVWLGMGVAAIVASMTRSDRLVTYSFMSLTAMPALHGLSFLVASVQFKSLEAAERGAVWLIVTVIIALIARLAEHPHPDLRAA